MRAIAVRSTCGSQNAQSTRCSKHFGEVNCRKSVRRFGAKRVSKSKKLRAPHARTTFEGWFGCGLAWQAKGILHLAKSEQNVGVLLQKAMAGVGHLKRVWKDAFCMAGAVQETFSS